MRKFKLPQHQLTSYVLNSEEEHFRRYTRKEFHFVKENVTRIPRELQLGIGWTTQQDAYGVICEVAGMNQSKQFLVNLYYTYFSQWFAGAEWIFDPQFDPDIHGCGTMLFHFCDSGNTLLIYYFSIHHCYDLDELLRFADSAIPDLLRSNFRR
jgi:hypothetical protein